MVGIKDIRVVADITLVKIIIFLFYLLDWSNRIGPKCLLIASELVTEVRRKFPPDFISSPVRARDRKPTSALG